MAKLSMTETQVAWLNANGIKAERHYEGFLFFCPNEHGYAMGSTVIARPTIGGGMHIEIRALSQWNPSLACFTAPRPVRVETLREALIQLRDERAE